MVLTLRGRQHPGPTASDAALLSLKGSDGGGGVEEPKLEKRHKTETRGLSSRETTSQSEKAPSVTSAQMTTLLTILGVKKFCSHV